MAGGDRERDVEEETRNQMMQNLFGDQSEDEEEADDDDDVEVVGEDYRPSGRYILASGRADEADGLRQSIKGALKPRVTYRVAGWISLGGGAAAEGAGHAVRVNLRVDDECVVEGGAVCAEAGKWAEIKGAFNSGSRRARAPPRCTCRARPRAST